MTRGWLAALLACGLAACAGSGPDKSGGGGGGGGKNCKNPPTPTVSLSQNVQPILNRSCAVSAACHGSPSSVYGNYSTGATYGAWVNVKSIEIPARLRVKPGDADASYVVQKIEGTAGIQGQQMPLGCPGQGQSGAECLTSDDISAIRQWVTECAPNN